MDPREESCFSRYFINVSAQRLLCYGLILLSCIVIFILLLTFLPGGDSAGPEEHKWSGRAILEDVPLIDGHNGLSSALMNVLNGTISSFPFDENVTSEELFSWCKTDIPKLKVGMVGTQVWTVNVPCSSQYKDAAAKTIQQIDLLLRLLGKYKNETTIVTSSEDIKTTFKGHKIGSMLGINGGHSIDNKLAILRTFYRLGVRYLTLTSDCNTPWAGSYTNNSKNELIISDFGQVIIKEMNRLGMIIDVAFLSPKAQLKVLEISDAPCIFSSAAMYDVGQHPPNIRPYVLEAVKTNAGIIMISFDGNLLRNETAKELATMNDLIEQINYVRKKIGVDYVGLGAGFNVKDSMTLKGLEDSSKYPELFDRLAAPEKGQVKWQPEELKKLAGLNFLRVFKRVEKVRDQHAEKPYENIISNSDIPKDSQTCYTS